MPRLASVERTRRELERKNLVKNEVSSLKIRAP